MWKLPSLLQPHLLLRTSESFYALFLLPTMPRSGSFAAYGQVERLGNMGPLTRFAFQERKPQEVVLHPEA